MPERKTVGQLMEEMRLKAGAQNYHGHEYMDLERFAEDTRHMIIFDVLTDDSPVGWKGERTRLFLTEAGYQKSLENQEKGHIKILSHAKVRQGHLLDASQYKYRFSVLRKLGVEDTHIGKLVLKQLGIWFGLPIVVAIIVSTMVIIYFIQTISAEISAYIGFGALMTQIGMTVSILALLLICYFISTWLLFKKSIK